MAGDTKIVAARRRRLRQWLDDRFGGGVGAQKAMIEDAKRRGYDINQGMLSGLLDNKSFGEVAAQNLEPKAGMPPGYLVTPLLPIDPASVPQFSRGQDAAESTADLRVVLSSLAATVLQKTQGAAAFFLEDLAKMAAQEGLPTDRGLVGRIANIAREVQNTSKVASPAPSRRGPAGRTKREK